MPDERNHEFDNLRVPDHLSAFDRDLHNILSPNPTHNKSIGLISTGNHVLSSFKLKPKPALDDLENQYLGYQPDPYSNPYSNGLDRSIVLK